MSSRADALLLDRSPRMVSGYVQSVRTYETPSLSLLAQLLQASHLHGRRTVPNDYGGSTACRVAYSDASTRWSISAKVDEVKVVVRERLKDVDVV
jgi:hypothetical protein